VPTLELKLGLRCLPRGALRELYEVAHFVAEVANVAADEHAPYVGHSAFAHKAGVHVAAMRRSAAAYQHVDPALVGNASRVVVSELSGRGNVLSKAEELGLEVADGVERDVLDTIKEGEARGFSFEAAEASVALMLRRRAPGYRAPFRLLEYKVMVGRRERVDDMDTFAEATIKVEVGDRVLHTAAEGNGPVSALDAALRKALAPAFPALLSTHLADYKVRILDGADGTAATTRVLVDHVDGARRWSTVGASPNIIEASWQALADGMEYALFLESETKDESTHRIASR
jgi:2-isopropylmalate synthase